MLWRFTYASVCTSAVLFLFHWLVLFQVPRSPWSLGEMSNHYPALSVSNLPSNADQGPTRPSYFRENIICPVFPTFPHPCSLVCSLRYPHWKQRTCSPLYFYLRLVVFFVWQNEVAVAKPHFWAWTFKGLEASLAFVALPSSWEVPAQATLWAQTEEERLSEQSSPCQDQARGASCSVGARVSKWGLLHSCGWLIHPLPCITVTCLGRKKLLLLTWPKAPQSHFTSSLRLSSGFCLFPKAFPDWSGSDGFLLPLISRALCTFNQEFILVLLYELAKDLCTSVPLTLDLSMMGSLLSSRFRCHLLRETFSDHRAPHPQHLRHPLHLLSTVSLRLSHPSLSGIICNFPWMCLLNVLVGNSWMACTLLR